MNAVNEIAQRLNDYIATHPFDSGDSDCETVLEQLYRVYAESHESDPCVIQEGFRELEEFLGHLPLKDNDAVFALVCTLCTHYEQKAYIDGVKTGAYLIQELKLSTCVIP